MITSFGLLDDLLKQSHSDDNAESGESYPVHLEKVLILYKEIRENDVGLDDEGTKKTPSQVNAQYQSAMIGVMPPAGSNDTAKSRSSTRAENARSYDLVT